MTYLAIKGHATRGKEVIEILEMLGGSNKHNYCADCDGLCFYIGTKTNVIYYDWVNSCYKDEDTFIFTLEEFLEKFPYKVGDKVRIPEYESEVPILSMNWNGYEVQYEVFTDETEWYSAKELNEYNEPHKEETMDRKNNDNWAKWELPDGYEFQDTDGNIINTSVIKLVKKQPEYPKTYEVCCMVINNACMTHKGGHKGELIQAFQKLLICRDAYWKMAGDWKPDWLDTKQDKFVLFTHNNAIQSNCFILGHNVLAFPTKEMRDAFYENFKELIEECKELL